MRYTLMTMLAVALLAASPAGKAGATECTDQAGNLLASHNCNATSDASEWSTTTSLSHEAGDGDPTPGSVRVDSTTPTWATIFTGCAAVAGSTDYNWGARLKLASGTPDSLVCNCNAQWYTTTDCTSSLAGFKVGVPETLTDTPGQWVTIQGGPWTSPASTQSGWVNCSCAPSGTGGIDYTVLYDNAMMGEGLDVVPVELTNFSVD